MATKPTIDLALKDQLNPDRYSADGTIRTVLHHFNWDTGLSIFIDIHDREEHGVCYAWALFKGDRVTGPGLLYFGEGKQTCVDAMKVIRDTYNV